MKLIELEGCLCGSGWINFAGVACGGGATDGVAWEAMPSAASEGSGPEAFSGCGGAAVVTGSQLSVEADELVHRLACCRLATANRRLSTAISAVVVSHILSRGTSRRKNISITTHSQDGGLELDLSLGRVIHHNSARINKPGQLFETLAP